ncbi:MAG: sigma-70 family RNA polymerase sigma factor [Chloroflexi bacterium]|nr:sigma-70 family RNA polymerase sigma factor [Chloroflexota bacterium]
MQKICPARALPRAEDERSLAEALRGRSPEAWAWLYDQHYAQIYRYARARTSDPTTAKDLAATTFLEALKSIHTYTYRGRPILAWLYRIARNVVAGHYRNSHRPFQRGWANGESQVLWYFLRSRRPQGPPPDPQALPDEISADADPAANIERLDLQAAIRRLPAEQREVIALRYYMGLQLAEVARVLGKPERKVYSLQAKAIEGLRRDFSE